MSAEQVPDLAVVGGGIVGLAVALTFVERGLGRAVVLEKEPAVARHQSGRNSGVLHSGLYYRPGSDKARLCRRGRELLEAACEREGVAWRRTGKVVVATDESELPRLDELERRGRANGVACQRIDARRLRELEPNVRGLAALHVPEAGIADFSGLCAAWAARLVATGNEVRTGVRVRSVTQVGEHVTLETGTGRVLARRAVVAAGLHADRMARASGVPMEATIVPFRGEYYRLTPEARELCRSLVYPVPDPRFPFLGVHLTRTIDGEVECGPNAVLALAREGYRWRDVALGETLASLTAPGFLRLAARHWRTGAGEVRRSLSRRAFADALRRLVPGLRDEHLLPARAGVRAQAVLPSGDLADDFLFERRGPILHVLNAPSPAATASLAIAEEVLAAAAL